MPDTVPVSEGFVSFRSFRTWYRVLGDLERPVPGTLPLLLLHGGPGMPHDCLEPLEALARTGRPVVLYDQLGCGDSEGPDDPTDVLPGLNFTVADAASIQKLGYEYAASSHVFPTDKSQGLTRFRSAESGAPPQVLSRFKKAEVRLHKMVQPPTSFTIRVFLNQPDADATTPIQGNDNYAGYLSIFGHGDCIGGPGHCDDQPRGVRLFDRRPPHHNKPYNARLDVTKTARRLITKGASDLSVHLVVMAPDEKRLSEMLRLDAVSLTFKD